MRSALWKILLAFVLAMLLMPLTACTHGPTAPIEECKVLELDYYYTWDGHTLVLDSVFETRRECPKKWTWA